VDQHHRPPTGMVRGIAQAAGRADDPVPAER
jgi:hypothetical protein